MSELRARRGGPRADPDAVRLRVAARAKPGTLCTTPRSSTRPSLGRMVSTLPVASTPGRRFRCNCPVDVKRPRFSRLCSRTRGCRGRRRAHGVSAERSSRCAVAALAGRAAHVVLVTMRRRSGDRRAFVSPLWHRRGRARSTAGVPPLARRGALRCHPAPLRAPEPLKPDARALATFTRGACVASTRRRAVGAHKRASAHSLECRSRAAWHVVRSGGRFSPAALPIDDSGELSAADDVLCGRLNLCPERGSNAGCSARWPVPRPRGTKRKPRAARLPGVIGNRPVFTGTATPCSSRAPPVRPVILHKRPDAPSVSQRRRFHERRTNDPSCHRHRGRGVSTAPRVPVVINLSFQIRCGWNSGSDAPIASARADRSRLPPHARTIGESGFRPLRARGAPEPIRRAPIRW